MGSPGRLELGLVGEGLEPRGVDWGLRPRWPGDIL